MVGRIALPAGYSAVYVDFDPTNDTVVEAAVEVQNLDVIGKRHMDFAKASTRCLCLTGHAGEHRVFIRAAQANKRSIVLRLRAIRCEPLQAPEAPAVHFGDNKVTIGMATYPEREAMLADTLPTIVDQGDNVFIYCNNYREAPASIAESRAHYIVDTASTLKAAAKFMWVGERGYHLTVDDDIYYPPDYVETLVKWLERYKRKALVGVHGFTMPEEVTKFPWRTAAYNFQSGLDNPTPVHVIGTGTIAFHQSLTERFPWAMMREHPASNDECLAVMARARNVPMILVPREDGWMRIHEQMKFGLFEEKGLNPAMRTPTLGLLKKYNPWPVPSLPHEVAYA
jgi:hypothetical protein